MGGLSYEKAVRDCFSLLIEQIRKYSKYDVEVPPFRVVACIDTTDNEYSCELHNLKARSEDYIIDLFSLRYDILYDNSIWSWPDILTQQELEKVLAVIEEKKLDIFQACFESRILIFQKIEFFFINNFKYKKMFEKALAKAKNYK